MVDKIKEILDKLYNKSKIKTLTKEDITKPIINTNNILHICAMRGLEEELIKLINIYKNNNIELDIKNSDGDNIIHLLFKNGFDEIVIKLFHNKILQVNILIQLNNLDDNPLFYCCDRYDTINKLYYLINKEIINKSNRNNHTVITKLILNIKEDTKEDKYYKLITKMIKIIDFSQPKAMPVLMFAILAKKTELSKYFIINNLGINNKNTFNWYPLNVACITNNIIIVKMLLDIDDDIRNGGIDNLNLPINVAIKHNYIELFELLSKYVKKYDTVDKYDNIYLHYILNSMIIYNRKINKSILEQYINNSDLDKKNVKGVTPKKLLKDLHKKNKIKIHIINKLNRQIKSRDKIKFNMTYKKSIKTKNINYGKFNSDIMHWFIYQYIILNKYNNVTMLKSSTSFKKQINNKLNNKLNNKQVMTYELKLKYITEYIEEYFNKLSVNLIIWKSNKINYINKNFIKTLNKELKKKKRFITIQLSMMLTLNVSHAEVIIIDKKNKTITRFEPYGVDSFEDEYILDNIIKKIVERTTKEKYKYYIPRDYLDSVKFQSVSRDDEEINKKLGDPIGYCLAWCFYFIELRLCNPDMDNEEMVKLGAKKILEVYGGKENPYLYFIREYAIHLNEEKDKLLKKIGIDKDDIYDINYKIDNIKKIYKNIK